MIRWTLEVDRYLQLCKDLLDVAETSMSDLHVLVKGDALEEWLRGVLKVVCEREELRQRHQAAVGRVTQRRQFAEELFPP